MRQHRNIPEEMLEAARIIADCLRRKRDLKLDYCEERSLIKPTVKEARQNDNQDTFTKDTAVQCSGGCENRGCIAGAPQSQGGGQEPQGRCKAGQETNDGGWR